MEPMTQPWAQPSHVKNQTMTAVVTHRPETSFSATENLSVYLNSWDNVEVKIPTNKFTK